MTRGRPVDSCWATVNGVAMTKNRSNLIERGRCLQEFTLWAPQTLEFRNFPYVFQWGEKGCYKLLKSID